MKEVKGFTLIELIITIAIIGILSAGVVFFTNPSQKIAESRDRKRRSDVYTIYGAIAQYSFLNEGLVPEIITSNEIDVIEIEGFLVPNFLDELPADPSCSSDISSGYYVKKNVVNEIAVTAPCAEGGEIIVDNVVF